MITFHIITIFPHIFNSYFKEGLLGKAIKKDLIKVEIRNLRDFTTDRHKTVDGRPFGGGVGMVLKIEPIYKAISAIKKRNKNARVILFSAKGKKLTQERIKSLAKLKNIVLICGRYEGVDERAAKYLADEEISIGEYVLSGGEIPAMVLVEGVSRYVKGVVGKEESLIDESFNSKNKKLEYPQYTRPENFRNWKVPAVLLSGNHKKIKEWQEKHRQ